MAGLPEAFTALTWPMLSLKIATRVVQYLLLMSQALVFLLSGLGRRLVPDVRRSLKAAAVSLRQDRQRHRQDRRHRRLPGKWSLASVVALLLECCYTLD